MHGNNGGPRRDTLSLLILIIFQLETFIHKKKLYQSQFKNDPTEKIENTILVNIFVVPDYFNS